VRQFAGTCSGRGFSRALPQARTPYLVIPSEAEAPAFCGLTHAQTRYDNLLAMNAVKVQIFGQIYTIRGELDERYVQKLAAYVDEKMSAIADVTATIDTQKVAVLAALAIADELHTVRKDRTEEEELLREQAERCLTLVERALKQTA
jgi:cell division protein ZapA